MKTILFPTDFSREAEKALPIAAQFARMLGADLYLIHVQYPALSPGWTPIPPLQAASEQSWHVAETAEQELKTLADAPCLKGVSVYTHLLEGTHVTDMLTDGRFAGADLVVMSSAGASGFQETLLGSNAERIIRHARMPVLVLKNPGGYLDLRSVVFASDFQDHYDECIAFLQDLLDCYSFPQVHLLFVNTVSRFVPSHEFQPRMDDFMGRYPLGASTTTVLNEYDVDEGILRFARDKKADLIVLGTHGRKGLGHLLRGSVAENVVNHAPIPVLVLPLKTDAVPMIVLEEIVPLMG